MILCAAIKYEDKIYSGKRHSDIIIRLIREFDLDRVVGEQGFLTDDSRFVTREEAAEIAFICGQTKVKRRILTSEDIY